MAPDQEDLTSRVSGGDEVSRAAFRRISPEQRATMRERILECITVSGNTGRTSLELQRILQIGHASCGPRLIELIDENLIHRPGRKRDRAWVNFAGPGKSVMRSTKDGVARERLEALERFCDSVRLTIRRGRLSGEGLEPMDQRLMELGFPR